MKITKTINKDLKVSFDPKSGIICFLIKEDNSWYEVIVKADKWNIKEE